MKEILHTLNYPLYLIQEISVFLLLAYCLLTLVFRKFPKNPKLGLLPIYIFIAIELVIGVYCMLVIYSGYHLEYCFAIKSMRFCN